MTGPKQIRDYAELIEAAREAAKLAWSSSKQRVVLIGGLALQLYGSPRLTGDIDVLAKRPVPALKPEKELSFGGYKSTTPNNVPVDVVIRDDDFKSLYNAALSHASHLKGIPIQVAKLEYLTAMKFVIDRPQDEADFNFIVTSTNVSIDQTEKIVRKHLGVYAVQEFRSSVEIARWKKSVGKL
jgi:hypothetical protein